MKENCINLEVVLANGKVIETAGHGARPRWKHPASKFLSFSRKTSAGYNLTELFLGSEGTLGVITQVCDPNTCDDDVQSTKTFLGHSPAPPLARMCDGCSGCLSQVANHPDLKVKTPHPKLAGCSKHCCCHPAGCSPNCQDRTVG